MAALNTNADDYVVVSGPHSYVDKQYRSWKRGRMMQKLVMFQKGGADLCLIKFLSPEDAAKVHENKQRNSEVGGSKFRSTESPLHEFFGAEHEAIVTENERLRKELTQVRERTSFLYRVTENRAVAYKNQSEQLDTELKRAHESHSYLYDKCQRLGKEIIQLKQKAKAEKKEVELLKIEVMHEKEERGRCIEQSNDQYQRLENLINQVEVGKEKIEQLKAELEEENVHLKNQAEADKREIELLKEQIASSTKISSSYEMSHAPRGVAVIINNIHFEDMAKRDGAEADTDRLREAFESLQFTVKTFHDLDHAKMVDVMKEQGKADHSNYNCFVCCVMSHGTMGKVFSSNDVGIDIYELMKPFNAKRCPSLKGKPKLFFTQSCQGERQQGRETFDGDHDAKPVPFICHEADFFLGLSTVPGYVARRDPDGAPYVHHLAKMLKDLGQTHDLHAIMDRVCDKMNEINDDKFGWISSNHSTLRKTVVFNKK